MTTPHDFPTNNRSGLETRLAAAGNDPDQILRSLDIEIALRRAGRKSGGAHKVQTMRLVSAAMLFLLLLGTCGALVYLHAQFPQRPYAPPPVIVTNPAPGPSAPGVAPGHQSAPPTR